MHAGREEREVFTRLIGPNFVRSLLAALAVGRAEGCSLNAMLTDLERLEPTPGRLQPIQLGNGALLLRDDFKSPVETITTALAVLKEVPAQRRLVVLGDAMDLGEGARAVYRRLGGLVATNA